VLVHEPEMMVVENIFRYAAEGVPVRAIQVRLQAEGTASGSTPRTLLSQLDDVREKVAAFH
jgi:hypothetical protein